MHIVLNEKIQIEKGKNDKKANFLSSQLLSVIKLQRWVRRMLNAKQLAQNSWKLLKAIKFNRLNDFFLEVFQSAKNDAYKLKL